MSKSNAPPLLALIPPTDLEPHQIATTKEGVPLPTHTFLRPLRTIDELMLYENGAIVWMEEYETLVVIYRRFNTFAPLDIKYLKFFQMYLQFGDGAVGFQIYGSAYGIIDTALHFARFEVSEKREMTSIIIHYNERLSFNAFHAMNLGLLLDALSTKSITLNSVNINRVLARVLATRAYPIDLTVLISSMDFEAFTDHLQGRTSSFGSLSLTSSVEDHDILRLSNHLHLFESINVTDPPSEFVLKLLYAPLRKLYFTVGPRTSETDCSTANIIPKDINILLDDSVDEFPTQFMSSFLYRVAQCGHLEQLRLKFPKNLSFPADVGRVLLDAVAANQNLRHLDLLFPGREFDLYAKDLLASLSNHRELRTFEIAGYPDQLDPEWLWVKQLLKRNRLIEEIFIYHGSKRLRDEIDAIHALNRFFHGSERLKKESTIPRPCFVKAALIRNAADDFQRAGMLLADHVDVVCELFHEVENVVMEAASEEGKQISSPSGTNKELKRKRSDAS
jgi:hypothetical protein